MWVIIYISAMKIGVIIPDRSDRPKFLANCLRMLDAQTVKPDVVSLVNFPAKWNDKPDITLRYRTGYNELRNQGLDCILFIENDDWYAPTYIEEVTKAWVQNGKPEIFGQQYTIYYNIKLRAWFQFNHYARSSAMNTLIKPDMNLRWPDDKEPYTDSFLWTRLKLNKMTYRPIKHNCIGIKHGEGMTGGSFHVDRLHRYEINKDPNFDFIRQVMDEDSFKFYSEYYD